MNHDDDIEWARQRMQAAIDDSNHAIERAREAEAKLANLLRQWSAVVEAAGLSPMLDDADGSRMTEALVRYLQPTPLPRSPCCNAAVRCGRCGDEFARRSPPINVTAPDPLAQLNALVKAGPVEIEEVDHKAGGKMISAMHLVRATGYEYMSDHRTLPETIDRLAQEVAKDQRKPDGYDPGARKDDETPIKTERP